jgi:hypothetical protein
VEQSSYLDGGKKKGNEVNKELLKIAKNMGAYQEDGGGGEAIFCGGGGKGPRRMVEVVRLVLVVEVGKVQGG